MNKRIKWIVAIAALLVLVGVGGWLVPHMMLGKLPADVKPIAVDSDLWRAMQAAYAAERSGDYKGAVELWTQALTIEPGPNMISDTLHAERGSAYNFLDMPKEAFADYDTALRNCSEGKVTRATALWYMGRGYAAINLRQFQRAKDDLDIVLKVAPKASNALGWRGAAYQGLGDRDHAIADYKAALALDPNNRRAEEELKILETP